jgi:hypothetical protein
MVGEREEVVLSAEEGTRYLMGLMTYAREDDVLKYVRSRIVGW